MSGDAAAARLGDLRELVVCSLEPWDEVWRRNQFFVDALLRRNPELRVLYVEPPADPLYDVSERRRPQLPRVRRVSPDGRLRAFRPVKLLPRMVGPAADRLLIGQVRAAAGVLRFSSPVLWVNDVTYAPLIDRTGWPTVYDVTDDWLLAPFPLRVHERLGRLERLALARAHEVVVCSSALALSRGGSRRVTLVPNGVDREHFRQARPRPADLPPPPAAVYVGTLHESRLDVALTVELARARRSLAVALVGPDALGERSRRLLRAEPNIRLLGARPYEQVPAYLQHADVIVVPHLVTPFTESLDPIKAYESRVVATPTVATPVAGFREGLGAALAERDEFVRRVFEVVDGGETPQPGHDVPSWVERSRQFEDVLRRAASHRLGR